MKKILLITCYVLLLTAAVSAEREKPLANANKDGLYAKSIEQVLRLEPEEIDLGTAVLIVSEQWSDMVQGRRYLTALDNMAYEIRRRLKKEKIPLNHKAMRVINKYLFEELGFEAMDDAGKPSDLFLHNVMDNKRGYCLSLSALYLSIGERLGLPLYGVVVPGHFFVRYDNGQTRFNIETTSKGGFAKDRHYLDKFKVPQDNDNIYMKNLSKIQTLGCFFNNLGNSYNEVGDMEQAQLALERAVEINPSLAESHTNLGNIYLKKDLLEKAIYEYQSALKIHSDEAKTHNNLGNAYFNRGWINDAISEYSYAIRLDPNFTDAYKNLSNAYYQQEMYSQAVIQLKEALALEPEDAVCYRLLGDAYHRMGKYEQAMSQYKKALKIKKDFAEAHYGIGLCYKELGEANNEIKSYKKALKLKPDMIDALMRLGNIYFVKEKYDAAIEQYKKAAQIKPDESSIHYNIGAAYSNKGEHEEAAIEYQKAVDIDPKMGDAHNGLAFALYRLESYDSAWHHIKAAESLGIEVSKELLAAIEDKL